MAMSTVIEGDHMTWILYGAATAVFLAAADFLIKFAAGKLSNSLGLFLYGSCTFASGLVWFGAERARGIPQFAQPAAVAAALGVGITFSLVTVGLYLTFESGAPISSASPFIRVGGLVLASLAGLVLLREPLTLRYVLGVVLACAGVYLMVFR